MLPGDGIGVDVIDATLPLLEKAAAAARRSRCASTTHPAGAQHYKATGEALPAATLDGGARRPTRSCSARWAGPTIRYPDGTEIAPQLDLRVDARALCRRAPGTRDPGHAAAARRPARGEASTSWSCASRPKACSPRAARATIDRRPRGARHDGDHARRSRAPARFRLPPRARAARRAGGPGASPASTRPTCSARWRSSARSSTSARAQFPDIEAPTTTTSTRPRSTSCASPGTSTCSSPRTCSATSSPTRRAALVGGMGMAPSADIGDEHGAVPAVPRLGARHRRPGQGQSDRDDPVRRADARLARRAARQRRRCAAAGARIERGGRRGVRVEAGALPTSSAGATARARSPTPCARQPLSDGRPGMTRRAASAPATSAASTWTAGSRDRRTCEWSAGATAIPRSATRRWRDVRRRRASSTMPHAMLDALRPDLRRHRDAAGHASRAGGARRGARHRRRSARSRSRRTCDEAVRRGRGRRARRHRCSSFTRTSASSPGIARRSGCSMPARSATLHARRVPPAAGRRPGAGAPISTGSPISSRCRASWSTRPRIHWIDTFRFLMGEVAAVTARLRRINPAIAGEDAGIIVFEFAGGATGLFDGNRLNDHVADEPAPHDGRDVARGLGRRAAPRRRGAPVVEAAPRRRGRARLRPRADRHASAAAAATRCSATSSRTCATARRSRTTGATTSPTSRPGSRLRARTPTRRLVSTL